MKLFTRTLSAGLVAAFAAPAFAQMEAIGVQLDAPLTSPKASVSQRIGLTDVTVTYCRPTVKGREIYGTRIVPYGGETPWRAGANENTKFVFSTDVTVEGKPLPAGSYGFHVLTNENEWTLIFNTVDNAWGSYAYKPENDALRVSVAPKDVPNVEALTYGFENLAADSATAYLAWEKKRVEFTIAVDLKETVTASFRHQLQGRAGLAWNANYDAAKWCLANEVYTEEALSWAAASVNRFPNEFNLRVQGELLAKMGKTDEAKAALEKALSMADDRRKGDIQKLIEGL